MDRGALEASYRQAEYHVRLGAQTLQLRPDQFRADNDARLRAAGCQGHWHLLTACNPGSQPLGADENSRRTVQLQRQLQAHGWTSRPAWSCAANGDWHEPGFCLFDADETVVMALAREYGQAAILSARLGAPPTLRWLQDAD